MKTLTDKQQRATAIAPHKERLDAEKRALITALRSLAITDYRTDVTGYRNGATPYTYASIPTADTHPVTIYDLKAAGLNVEIGYEFITITL